MPCASLADAAPDRGGVDPDVDESPRYAGTRAALQSGQVKKLRSGTVWPFSQIQERSIAMIEVKTSSARKEAPGRASAADAPQPRQPLAVAGSVGGAAQVVVEHQLAGVVDVPQPDDVGQLVVDDRLGEGGLTGTEVGEQLPVRASPVSTSSS